LQVSLQKRRCRNEVSNRLANRSLQKPSIEGRCKVNHSEKIGKEFLFAFSGEPLMQVKAFLADRMLTGIRSRDI